MDEMGKNLVNDKYPPEPAKPGQVAREGYSYEKEGSANLFIETSCAAGAPLHMKTRFQKTYSACYRNSTAAFYWYVNLMEGVSQCLSPLA